MGRMRQIAKHVLENALGISIATSFSRRTKDVMSELGVNLAIDVGANRGQYAQGLRASGYRGDIISFEPASAAFGVLQRNSASDAKWSIHQYALGSKASSGTLQVFSDDSFNSLLHKNEFCDRRFAYATTDVCQEAIEIKRLDQVFEELLPNNENTRILLKMDTQGYDLEVFNGLGEKRDLVVAVQSELSLVPIYENMPDWCEMLSQFRQAGFGVVDMRAVTRVGARVIEYDCLMTRVDPL